jgi:cobalamin biosynthesis Co2+ chelatase CbiK
MKCYYSIDPKTKKKIFIPMCYGTIHTLNKEDCCCDEPLTEYQFEKERFNKAMEQKNETIKEMQSELNRLRKIIKDLTN